MRAGLRFSTIALFLCFSLQALEIRITDASSPHKEEIIQESLLLQHAWMLEKTDSQSLPSKALEYGFFSLEIPFEEISYIINQKQGKLITAHLNDMMVGYLLVAEISQLEIAYEDPSIGQLEVFDALFVPVLQERKALYIEQIAAHPDYPRKGIGSSLINACKELAPHGLIADIFTKPKRNEASFSFFSRMGFIGVATLHEEETDHFPAFETEIVFWHPNQ